MVPLIFCFRCILGELFTRKPLFQATNELAQYEVIRWVIGAERFLVGGGNCH